MAAIGKTLDLFESAATTRSAAALKNKPPLHKNSGAPSAKPALKVAPRPQHPPAAEPAVREELWLAIHLPQLALDALQAFENSASGSALPEHDPAAAIAQGSFQYITREITQGSRRGFAADQIYFKHQRVQSQEAIHTLRQRSRTNDLAASPVKRHLQKSTKWVVIDGTHNQQRVLTCNEAARASGITPGCGLNAAYALASDLEVRARDTAAEERLLNYIAQWAGSFTPRVCLEEPDTVLLEIKGSLKLFGGNEALLQLIASGLKAKHIETVLAIAPTSIAALAFSRTGQPIRCLRRSQLPAALSAVPITSMRWPEDMSNTLYSMGVQTLGDCLRLPREGFARRFGPAMLLELDQLVGRAAQPRRTFVARERFTAKQDCEVEIESHSHLLHVIHPLITSMERFLRLRQAGVQSLELKLRHRDHEPTVVILRFVRTTSDAAHCMEVLTERLERLELIAPVIAIRLRSGPIWPLEMEIIAHRALADRTQENAHAVARMVERLRARLGADAVYSLKCIAEHRPELASKVGEPKLTSKKAKATKGATKAVHANQPLSRPFWILPQSQTLEARRSWPYFQGKLELCQGPERIESGWWDGHDVSRDYYIARTPKGLRLWIYRDRKSREWHLHGVYG